MTMRFGAFTALDDVSIRIEPGTFHALLGENGAGKSTLVKCMMGFYHATSGRCSSTSAKRSSRSAGRACLGLGMVYQHFTLVPLADRGGKPRDQPQGRARGSSTGGPKRARSGRLHVADALHRCRSTDRSGRSPQGRSRSSKS
jgi:ABC-type glutathione transport system ATPase component